MQYNNILLHNQLQEGTDKKSFKENNSMALVALSIYICYTHIFAIVHQRNCNFQSRRSFGQFPALVYIEYANTKQPTMAAASLQPQKNFNMPKYWEPSWKIFA